MARLRHRPAQGAGHVPQLPRRHRRAPSRMTGDPRRWPNEPGIARGRALLRSLPRTARRSTPPPRPRSASGRCAHLADVHHARRARHRRRRHRSRPSSAPTASSCRPTATWPASARCATDHGILLIADEVMAGFGRCGEWFAIDHWGVQPDLICFAKGVNSGYVPLGGVVLGPRVADVFADRAVPRRPHLLGSPAGLRRGGGLDAGHDRRGHHRARPRRSAADVIGPAPAGAGRTATRRWARCAGSACSGPSSSCATARPASRWCPSTPPGEAAAPMAEVVAACKAGGRVAVHPLQPHPRRAAVHHQRRRRPPRHRRARRGPRPSPTATPREPERSVPPGDAEATGADRHRVRRRLPRASTSIGSKSSPRDVEAVVLERVDRLLGDVPCRVGRLVGLPRGTVVPSAFLC